MLFYKMFTIRIHMGVLFQPPLFYFLLSAHSLSHRTFLTQKTITTLLFVFYLKCYYSTTHAIIQRSTKQHRFGQSANLSSLHPFLCPFQPFSCCLLFFFDILVMVFLSQTLGILLFLRHKRRILLLAYSKQREDSSPILWNLSCEAQRFPVPVQIIHKFPKAHVSTSSLNLFYNNKKYLSIHFSIFYYIL